MAGWNKLSFHARLLILVFGTAWMFVGAFIVWQYIREKQFKIELLDTQLQMHNRRIIYDMSRGEDIGSVVSRINAPRPDVRVTLIDSQGRVTFDTNDSLGVGNHADRPEVISAAKYGKGYVASRRSLIDGHDYFYSATRGPYGLVVRTAVPYDHSLLDTLKADRQFLWAMALITCIISVIGWFGTRKISRSIKRLNDFAERAEKGERIFDYASYPNDELGAISSHVVRLYARLQEVMDERDLQHSEAMKAERAKERFKKQLTIDINHELKTPVASIILSLDTLHDFPDLPVAQREMIEKRIFNNAHRLQDMLKDVSLITRMDEGLDMIHFSNVSLADIVNEVIADLTPIASQKGIVIHSIMPSSPLLAKGNSSLLESVFKNLIYNSILYSGCTEISVFTDGAGLWRISDNGCGIPEEHHTRIFDRFYRMDAGRSREAGGTGLGLAIVLNSVMLHGGHITLYNTHPGVTFEFTIPVH